MVLFQFIYVEFFNDMIKDHYAFSVSVSFLLLQIILIATTVFFTISGDHIIHGGSASSHVNARRYGK